MFDKKQIVLTHKRTQLSYLLVFIFICLGPPEYDGGVAISEFVVEMTAADPDGPAQEVHRGPADVTECCVNNLLPGKVYSFAVQAFNRVGVSGSLKPL